MIYEYNLTDHLGNTRITFGDADADGLADILQENHYYPFGMAMTMSSTLAAAPPNNYLYNGKELQDEFGLGWYDYGARMYDASIGRWNGVDALSEKYVGWSPYNYVMGNPIRLIDPDGKEVWIHFEEAKRDKNGNIKKNRRGETKYRHRKVRYDDGVLYDKKGNEYTGENQFVTDVKNSIDYIQEGKDGATADPDGIISSLVSSKRKVKISKGEKTRYFEGEVFFNPEQGLGLLTNEGEWTGETQSPALGLFHELDHANRAIITDPLSYIDDLETTNPIWGTKEEYRVISGSETKAAEILKEGTRTNHYGKPFPVKGGPTSNVPDLDKINE